MNGAEMRFLVTETAIEDLEAHVDALYGLRSDRAATLVTTWLGGFVTTLAACLGAFVASPGAIEWPAVSGLLLFSLGAMTAGGWLVRQSARLAVEITSSKDYVIRLRAVYR